MSAFAEELSFLNRKDSKFTPPVRVAQFGLFLSEDQTIKCKVRIDNAPLLTSSKFPILLPPKHPFVNLMVKQAHDLVKHSGINATSMALRERLWILRGRETVKRIIRRCVVCRRYETKPCKPTRLADLPENRVSKDPPFSHIGLDFAGPFYVKEPRTSSVKPRLQQGLCVFVYMCLNSSRASGIDSRNECTRFPFSLSQTRQQTRITGYNTINTIRQRKNFQILQ